MDSQLEELKKAFESDKLVRIDIELTDGSIYVFDDPLILDLIKKIALIKFDQAP